MDSKNRKKILITGAAGFIGSNLCKLLLTKDAQIFAVDNLVTGQIKNLDSCLDHPDFLFERADIVSRDFLEKYSRIPFSKIYHLACPTGVPNIKILGEEMLLACSIGTRHVLEIAKKQGSTVLNTSSSEIYGNPQMFPQSETYNGNVSPVGTRSPYEEGKRFGESLTALYWTKYGVKTKIVRLFNTYGPGMSLRDQRVVPQFIKGVLQNGKFTIYGDGSQKRPFLYITDLLAALLLVMDQGRPGEVYNIGGAEEMTILELANLLKKITGSENKIEFLQHFIEDHHSRRPALGKIRGLGWRPKISLEEGLRRMIDSYRLSDQEDTSVGSVSVASKIARSF